MEDRSHGMKGSDSPPEIRARIPSMSASGALRRGPPARLARTTTPYPSRGLHHDVNTIGGEELPIFQTSSVQEQREESADVLGTGHDACGGLRPTCRTRVANRDEPPEKVSMARGT